MSNDNSIVFINQSSGYLMIDIIHQHLRKYDKVILLTGFLNPRNTELDEHVVVHMLSPYDRKNLFTRTWSWIVFTLQTFWLLTIKYRQSSLYLVSNPPLTVFLARLLNRPTSFLIYDVYPDALIEYKFSKRGSFLVKWWAKVNRKAFKKAKQIFTISPGMKKLLAKYVDEDKIEIVPIWTDNKFLQPIEKSENPWLKNHDLQESFIIMYSGNLGITQPVEILIELAKKLRNAPIKFIIIGEGEKKQWLTKQVQDLQLNNVLLLPYQPIELFPYSLAAADIGIVILGTQASQLSVPSKTYNLMSVGMPILAIAGKDSELAELIEKHQNGMRFSPDEVDKIIEYLKDILQDRSKLLKMGKNSLKASKQYGSENAKKMIFKQHV